MQVKAVAGARSAPCNFAIDKANTNAWFDNGRFSPDIMLQGDMAFLKQQQE